MGAVHQVVLDNNLVKLEKLIEDDFPLDERDAHSLTPLHLAVSLGREDLVRALLGGGACPSSRTGPPHKGRFKKTWNKFFIKWWVVVWG